MEGVPHDIYRLAGYHQFAVERQIGELVVHDVIVDRRRAQFSERREDRRRFDDGGQRCDANDRTPRRWQDLS
jgi:hypothetical protein